MKLLYALIYGIILPTMMFAEATPVNSSRQSLILTKLELFKVSIPENWRKQPTDNGQGIEYQSPHKTNIHGIEIGASVSEAHFDAGGATLKDLKVQLDDLAKSNFDELNKAVLEELGRADCNVALEELKNYKSEIKKVSGIECITMKTSSYISIENDKGITMLAVGCFRLLNGEIYTITINAPAKIFKENEELLMEMFSSIEIIK